MKKLLIFAVLVAMASCIPQKKLIYMQDKTAEKGYTNPYQRAEQITELYKVQAGDYLYIRVNSTREEIDKLYNLGSNQQLPQMGQATSAKYYSYLVKDNGTIDFPYLGEVVVAGKTTTEIKHEIHARLSRSMDSFSVQVVLTNASFSVLGEVRKPGQYPMSRDQITLFEAISMAGDITGFGKRNQIRIVRPTPEGSLTLNVDLTDKNVVDSQRYFIYPNDLIYVEPMAIKQYGIGETFSFSMISWLISIGLFINTINK
jgi:polysaccharide export outer membrane protein